MDFLHIGYHDQVSRDADSYKIEFGSVPHLSNYGNFFINVECLLCYLRDECGDFVDIWYSYQVPCVPHASKLVFGSVPNLSNCGHFFIHFVYLW